MRAIQLQSLDGPQALKLVEVDRPMAAPGQVLIDVKAAGVGFVDLLVSRGLYQEARTPPIIQGIEVAGIVADAPEGTTHRPGDRVAAFLSYGGFAEAALAPAEMTFRLPAELDFREGAAYVLNYHTAYFAFARRGRLTAGERVLVHGAAGGVGTAAIQVARALGAEVVAVVRSDEKATIARRAGADRVAVIDEHGDWLEAARDLVRGGAFDLAIDPVGGALVDDTVRALAPEGRLLVVGFAAGGGIPGIKLNRLLLKNVDVAGVFWGGFLKHEPALSAETDRALAVMAADGHIRPVLGRSYALSQAAEAMEDLEAGRVTGKLVLDV